MTKIERQLCNYPLIKKEMYREFIKSLVRHNIVSIEAPDKAFYFPCFHYFRCFLKSGCGEIVGTGESFKKKMAIEKSVGEVLERVPIYCKNVEWDCYVESSSTSINSSNGLSFGLSTRDCIVRSYRESIERHVVLDYWYSKRECSEIIGHNITLILNAAFSFQKNKCCRFYLLKNDFGMYVVVCHISSKDKPYNIYGYGCNENINYAMEKAFLES